MTDETAVMTETGVQLLSRVRRRSCLAHLEPALFAQGRLEAGNVVEISGAANSGKSELLLHLIRKCILPVNWNDAACGGLQVQVVYVDNDRHFSLPRLIGLLEERFKAAVPSPGTDQLVHTFILDCLSRLNLINGCSGSGQFILTLHYMDSFMSAPKYDCAVLFVDSISAFYYEDRMLHADNLGRLDAHHRNIAALLKSLTVKYGFTVIFTKQHLMNSRDFNFMGSSLNNIISWKVNLIRDCETRVEIQRENNCWTNFFSVFDDGIRFGKNTL